MKATVKLPKSVKRMLATMDRPARQAFLKLFVEAVAQDASRSRRTPVNLPNDNQE